MAALEGGFLSPEEGLGGGQCIDVGGENFCNAGHADYGSVGLVEALKVSSDTYFFEVGERANSHNEAIQHMAHLLGIGEPTQIDLPSEIDGVVPNAKWREEMNALQVQVRTRRTPAAAAATSPKSSPGRSAKTWISRSGRAPCRPRRCRWRRRIRRS